LAYQKLQVLNVVDKYKLIFSTSQYVTSEARL